MQIWCRNVQSAANMLPFIFQLSAGVLHIFCRVGRKMWSNKWETGASGRSIAKFRLQSWWRSSSYPFHYSYRYVSISVSMHMRYLPFRFTWNASSQCRLDTLRMGEIIVLLKWAFLCRMNIFTVVWSSFNWSKQKLVLCKLILGTGKPLFYCLNPFCL